jgi:hypothetical protein
MCHGAHVFSFDQKVLMPDILAVVGLDSMRGIFLVQGGRDSPVIIRH